MWSMALIIAVGALLSLKPFTLNRQRESVVAFSATLLVLTMLLLGNRLG